MSNPMAFKKPKCVNINNNTGKEFLPRSNVDKGRTSDKCRKCERLVIYLVNMRK